MMEFFQVPDYLTLILLSGAALSAGLMDSIAGGGGLITVPVLLICGLPPQTALGTNKLQACFGSGTALIRYARAGLIPKADVLPAVIFTALGAVGGTFAVQIIPTGGLAWIVPILLIMVFIYLIFKKSWGEKPQPAKMNALGFFAVFGLVLGFYDGFLGPGTGAFWTLALTGLLGRDLRGATAETKVANFTSNVVSLLVFSLLGHVLLSLGLLMGAFQTLGAWMGSKLVIKKGIGLIRILFLTVVALTLLKLLWGLLWP